MVVTRRAPAPVPTSRTNSSQPIPRVRSKGPQDPTQPSAPSPLSNGVTTDELNSKPADGQSKSDPEVCSSFSPDRLYVAVHAAVPAGVYFITRS